MTGIVEEITLNEMNQLQDGTYAITYTIPDGIGPLKFEIIGDVDGLPEVNHIVVVREI
jgi:hypothetical protein